MVTGSVTDVAPNIPQSLNESYSLQRVFAYEIFIEHIFYKSFLINHLTKISTYQQDKHWITMLFIQNYRHVSNQSLIHVHTRANINIGIIIE